MQKLTICSLLDMSSSMKDKKTVSIYVASEDWDFVHGYFARIDVPFSRVCNTVLENFADSLRKAGYNGEEKGKLELYRIFERAQENRAAQILDSIQLARDEMRKIEEKG